jgi:hypothetical protein
MKQIDLSIVVNETFLKSYLNSINVNNINSALSDIKYKIIIDNLEDIITTNDLSKYTKIWNYYYSKDEMKEIEEAFDYGAHRQNPNFMEHFKKINIKSCPFCNNNYVYFYKEGAKKFNTLATLEHYYPKSKYPHLSLSFYNLIPSCNTCNSKFKGSDEIHVGNILHPYFEDFNEKAQFSVRVDGLPVNKTIELEVNLKSNDERCKTSIDRFQLDKIYKQHNDIAKEIWNKAQVYNESRIEELYESFYKDLGYSKDDVKNMVFCNYLHKDDIHKRNHSKLTQDILKQFGIKK